MSFHGSLIRLTCIIVAEISTVHRPDTQISDQTRLQGIILELKVSVFGCSTAVAAAAVSVFELEQQLAPLRCMDP